MKTRNRKPSEIRIVDNVAYITLTHGYVAKIDIEDIAKVSGRPWHSDFEHKRIYARSNKARMHKLILPNLMRIDHIDGDGLNNQKSNLRACNQSQNIANSPKRTHSTQKYKGIKFDKRFNHYMARIGYKRKSLYLGVFKTPEEAALAYNAKAKELFGEYAYINKITI